MYDNIIPVFYLNTLPRAPSKTLAVFMITEGAFLQTDV